MTLTGVAFMLLGGFVFCLGVGFVASGATLMGILGIVLGAIAMANEIRQMP